MRGRTAVQITTVLGFIPITIPLGGRGLRQVMGMGKELALLDVVFDCIDHWILNSSDGLHKHKVRWECEPVEEDKKVGEPSIIMHSELSSIKYRMEISRQILFRELYLLQDVELDSCEVMGVADPRFWARSGTGG
ncbi:hypothetical protein GWI33_003346 [Rhynchophorus ferrugineus]|uniref:Uncharacterized protein n=1 Tax=Rhynchophorus ferrugineus TaxID=354439 RepID=A0A834IXW7_RHYFE|nr:hypothetical protein GWI33_003346 [Rhynchophorus ferrugineus]